MVQDLYGRDVKRRKNKADGNGTGTGTGTGTSAISSSSFLSLKAELARQHQSSSSSSSSSPISFSPSKASAVAIEHRALPLPINSDHTIPHSQHDSSAAYSLSSGSAFDKAKRKLPEHLLPSTSAGTSSSKRGKDINRSSGRSSNNENSARTKGSTKTLSSWSSTPSAQLERDRNLVLDRKAKLYDQLKKGLSGGLSLEDLQDQGKLGGLVDWERKLEQAEEDDDLELEREEGREEERVEGDEDLVEYQDELGRTRMIPKSQVPIAYLIEMKRREEERSAAESNLPLYGPQHHFPILTTASTFASSHADSGPNDREGLAPPDQHFDSQAEVRNRGAAFYRFAAGDEEARKKQMQELNEERQRTLRERGERQAEAAQGEGGDEPFQSSSFTPHVTDTLSKGERRLNERRALVEARRIELAIARASSVAEAAHPAEDGTTATAATAGVGVNAEASSGCAGDQSKTPGEDQTTFEGEEQRRRSEYQRERQRRAIDRFLEEVDDEYRSKQQQQDDDDAGVGPFRST